MSGLSSRLSSGLAFIRDLTVFCLGTVAGIVVWGATVGALGAIAWLTFRFLTEAR